MANTFYSLHALVVKMLAIHLLVNSSTSDLGSISYLGRSSLHKVFVLFCMMDTLPILPVPFRRNQKTLPCRKVRKGTGVVSTKRKRHGL